MSHSTPPSTPELGMQELEKLANIEGDDLLTKTRHSTGCSSGEHDGSSSNSAVGKSPANEYESVFSNLLDLQIGSHTDARTSGGRDLPLWSAAGLEKAEGRPIRGHDWAPTWSSTQPEASSTPPTSMSLSPGVSLTEKHTEAMYQQQIVAVTMHLLANGYPKPYAQMAAIAAVHQTNLAAYQYQSAAAHQAGHGNSGRHYASPYYTWTGELPPRNYTNPEFSSKIFVGGVPWDITEAALLEAFRPYGSCQVEWPGKEARYTRAVIRPAPKSRTTGYVYIVFENERSVRFLLGDCSQEFGSAGEWYFKLTARRMHTKEIRQVQIIPWVVSDASYMAAGGQSDSISIRDTKRTVFVGALHGMITAQILFGIMEELFGEVVAVYIDTDKYKYPIGSGRVTFGNDQAYLTAIEAQFLEVKTSKFQKTVQIDPFLEEAVCSMCQSSLGPYFCRDKLCFRYYCNTCWQTRHTPHSFRHHKPLMRNARRASVESEQCLSPHPNGSRLRYWTTSSAAAGANNGPTNGGSVWSTAMDGERHGNPGSPMTPGPAAISDQLAINNVFLYGHPGTNF